MSAVRIDHLAFPSFDAGETHRFYSEVMQFPLVFAFQGDSDSWGSRYLMMSYAVGRNAAIDFFALEGMHRPPEDDLPRDIRHVALAVGSKQDLARWQQRLERHGTAYVTEDHGDGELHLYFSDPNGVMFELSSGSDTASADTDSAEALAVVRDWTETHDRPPKT